MQDTLVIANIESEAWEKVVKADYITTYLKYLVYDMSTVTSLLKSADFDRLYLKTMTKFSLVDMLKHLESVF